jgi:hypothetical protein
MQEMFNKVVEEAAELRESYRRNFEERVEKILQSGRS